MSLFDRKTELKEKILAAIKGVAERLNAERSDGKVYALVILPSSGYRDIGVSFADDSHVRDAPGNGRDPDLLEMLKDHPDLMQQASAQDKSYSAEVNACEWTGAGSHTDLFSTVNDIIDSEYDGLYDVGVENAGICDFFERLLTEVLQEVRAGSVISGPAFSDDILTGVQFPDSGNTDTVKRISKVVNSPAWHEKVCAGYGS